VRRLAVAAVIVGLGALLFSSSAQACSCAPVSRSEAIQRADAAIAGRLLKVVPRDHERAVYRYRVQRVYKQSAGIQQGKVISVHGARDSAACGLPTRTEHRYELALSWSGGAWTSGACALLRDCAS
jgi:hypothetical protein